MLRLIRLAKREADVIVVWTNRTCASPRGLVVIGEIRGLPTYRYIIYAYIYGLSGQLKAVTYLTTGIFCYSV